LKVFKTHEEANLYAKNNPGVVVMRNQDASGYTIKNSKIQVQDFRKLLLDTKSELNYLCSCILQTNPKTAYTITNKAGELLASKLAGLGFSGGMLGIVSTFGTAGTGTAIGTLSGAAATNATLAWIGGIIGGGMFAGTILTGGLAMGVGIFTYKLFKSKPREYEKLEKIDRQVVDKCIILIRVIDELTDGVNIPEKEVVKNFAKNDIMELYKLVKEHKNDMKKRMDKKNHLAFSIKSLPSLDKIVIRYSEL
jgi:hypothetical protein